METQGNGNQEGFIKRTSPKQGIEKQNRKVLSGTNGSNRVGLFNESLNEDQGYDECSINLQDDQIILVDEQNNKQEDQEEDIPTTQEEIQTVEELLNDDEIEEKRKLKEEYLETRKFYSKLRGLNQYDLTEANFKYWKGKPYVGSSYREFIKKSSKIMVCTALVNERIQINVFDKLIHEKKNNTIPIENGILKYVKYNKSSFTTDNVYYSKKSVEFLNWRFKSHLFRFGFIKKYLNDEYQLDYNDFRTYSNIEKYFELIL
jgi:hypothetical protein